MSITGKLIVKFYGNPKDTYTEDEVSVVYTGDIKNIGKVENDFVMYVTKILYNLGKNNPGTHMLTSTLNGIFSNNICKNTDVLHGSNYSLKRTEDKGKHRKICEATFYDDRPPKTKSSWGGEGYYPPMSVLAFLQFIIDELPEGKMKIFNDNFLNII